MNAFLNIFTATVQGCCVFFHRYRGSEVIFPLWTKWLVTNPMPTQYWHEVGTRNCWSLLALISKTRWWFQMCFIFNPIWGRFPFWLIFFRWVETTNQKSIFWWEDIKTYQNHVGRTICFDSIDFESTLFDPQWVVNGFVCNRFGKGRCCRIDC